MLRMVLYAMPDLLTGALTVETVYEQQCTVMLLSHQLLAFPQAGLVVVLDRGRILEQGTHAELSTGNGLYARIYRPSVWPA